MATSATLAMAAKARELKTSWRKYYRPKPRRARLYCARFRETGSH